MDPFAAAASLSMKVASLDQKAMISRKLQACKRRLGGRIWTKVAVVLVVVVASLAAESEALGLLGGLVSRKALPEDSLPVISIYIVQ